jgi:RNA polymerase sigma-54 factor
MKQSLQLRHCQQITMTPQLQQAIRLLQLSTLELQTEIQQTLESNFMLELADDEDNELDSEEAPAINLEGENNVEVNSSAAGVEGTLDLSFPDSDELAPETNEISLANLSDIPDDLAADTGWEEVYDSTLSSYDYPTNDENNGKDLSSLNSTAQSLQDDLRWQLDLTPFSDVDRVIALAIIDALDDDGYLRVPVAEIIQSLGRDIRVDAAEVEVVLHRVQHFEPVGIAARNLSECLLLQLEECDLHTPWLKETRILASKHLDLLGAHDYVQLSKRLKVESEELREIIDLIQSLKPRPGALLEPQQVTYIIPDVFVRKNKGQWKVELNSEVSPKLRINAHYASLISRTHNNTDTISIKNHLQEARWFIKSLKSRHETLLKVSKCIVKRQSAFLEYGEEAMKPLVLHDISSELEMHESTISRVTTHKYIHTPRGIFELKYFFSSHVNTNNGGECSSTAIRALIKKLVASESTAKPLSDSKIAKILFDRGINVARRTVAKYREAMLIPPSNERKGLPE